MKKQDFKLYGLILGLCTILLLVCALMMPEIPSPTMTNSSVNNDLSAPKSESGYVVVLDPGHGGYDIGGKSDDGSIVENEYDLKIALKVKTILENEGIRVVMTRTSDEVSWPSNNAKDLQARLDIATNANADLMVSIHCNASDDDNMDIRGSEVYVNTQQKGSVALANAIVNRLDELAPRHPSRGVKVGALHLLTFNTVPTVIVEMGFLSNPDDVEYLSNAQNQDFLAEKIAYGIIDALKK